MKTAFIPLRVSLALLFLSAAVPATILGQDLPFELGTHWTARDSLEISGEESADAQECLKELAWEPAEFEVRSGVAKERRYQALIRFDSPVATDDPVNDEVAMEWHVARGDDGNFLRAPAVIVVHESGSQMAIGRLIARSLAFHRVHAFMIQLPGYGERRGPNHRQDPTAMLRHFKQAIADVRRARDAVAVLPMVDASHIALQGTSLGGFISSSAAALDTGFDSVHVMLAGGDLLGVLEKGERDAARVRRRLEEAGVTGEDLRRYVRPIEPTRTAHRLDPTRTWLYSGRDDKVVPLDNALMLARAAKLPDSHHVIMNANHYTGIVYLPIILREMSRKIEKLSDQESKQP